MIFLSFRRSMCGGPRRDRIPNLLIRSQTLYPIELWARKNAVKEPYQTKKQTRFLLNRFEVCQYHFCEFGAAVAAHYRGLCQTFMLSISPQICVLLMSVPS